MHAAYELCIVVLCTIRPPIGSTWTASSRQTRASGFLNTVLVYRLSSENVQLRASLISLQHGISAECGLEDQPAEDAVAAAETEAVHSDSFSRTVAAVLLIGQSRNMHLLHVFIHLA